MAQRRWQRRTFLASGLALGCGPARCDSDSPAPLRVDERRSHQTLEGWGTALIDWKEEFAQLYPSDWFATYYLQKLGASALRVGLRHDTVGPERSLSDITAASFETESTRGGKQLLAAAFLSKRAPLRVIATVWTPPVWMKHNADSSPKDSGNGHPERQNYALSFDELGRAELDHRATTERARYLYANRLRTDRRLHFAKSLLEWARLYAAHGAPLYGLSLQNEPRFSHWFGSCVYTAPAYAATLSAVERVFSEHRVDLPRLFGPETMAHDDAGNRLYLDALFSGNAPGQALHALASHGYVDGYDSDENPRSAAQFERLASERKTAIWMTEGGTGGHEWPAPLHDLGASLHNALVHGRASLVTPWQALSEEPDEHGLGALSQPTKKLSVATHFFRYLPPGAVRLEARCSACDVAAFRVGHELVLQLLNRSRTTRRVTLSLAPRASQWAQLVTTSANDDLTPTVASTGQAWALAPESITTAVIPWAGPDAGRNQSAHTRMERDSVQLGSGGPLAAREP